MLSIRNAVGLGLALSCALLPAAARAQFTTTIVTGATVTPDADDISQLDFSGPIHYSEDFSDNGGAPGQTFTTLGNAGGYTLDNLTLKGGDFAGSNYGYTDYHVRISSVGAGGALTDLATFTANGQPLIDSLDAYLTLDLSGANLTLSSGTTYAFDIYSEQGYFRFATSGSGGGDADLYGGGTALNDVSPSRSFNGTFTPHAGYDRTFNVGLSALAAAPEPSQFAAFAVGLLGLGVLSLRARRRTA